MNKMRTRTISEWRELAYRSFCPTSELQAIAQAFIAGYWSRTLQVRPNTIVHQTHKAMVRKARLIRDGKLDWQA